MDDLPYDPRCIQSPASDITFIGIEQAKAFCTEFDQQFPNVRPCNLVHDALYLEIRKEPPMNERMESDNANFFGALIGEHRKPDKDEGPTLFDIPIPELHARHKASIEAAFAANQMEYIGAAEVARRDYTYALECELEAIKLCEGFQPQLSGLKGIAAQWAVRCGEFETAKRLIAEVVDDPGTHPDTKKFCEELLQMKGWPV